ncbi:MAG: lysophospholipid acyltransferase family protein, partial [Candidatus Saccharibacteria bacterium]|nr:lysophospholipid acyltransferase family protein [Candidatus Saccharibacteria bacterium]
MAGNSKWLKKQRSSWRYQLRRVIQATVLKRWLKHNFSITVKGTENLVGLPTNKGFIIVANHQSHLDAPLLIGSLPHKIGARVAVGAAGDYFFRGYWQSKPTRLLLNTFPIGRRGDKRYQGIAADLIGSGVPILVFPEGTRSRTGKLGNFHSGAMRIAVANQTPILPVAMVGNGRAWPVGAKK